MTIGPTVVRDRSGRARLSTLITSAPYAPRITVACGPAIAQPRSRMRAPRSGPAASATGDFITHLPTVFVYVLLKRQSLPAGSRWAGTGICRVAKGQHDRDAVLRRQAERRRCAFR